MFFIIGGCLETLYIDTPHTFVYPLYICTPPGMYTPQYVLHTPLCICIFSEAFGCCGGCKGLPYVLGHFPYPTLYGSASPLVHPHTQLLASLCIGMFWGYLYVM